MYLLFLRGYFSPRIAADIGPLILLIFFGMLVVAFIYVFLFMFETKGLSLEQVDEMYKSGIKPWHSAGFVPKHGSAKKGAFERTLYPSEQRALDEKNGVVGRSRVERDEQQHVLGEDEEKRSVGSPVGEKHEAVEHREHA